MTNHSTNRMLAAALCCSLGASPVALGQTAAQTPYGPGHGPSGPGMMGSEQMPPYTPGTMGGRGGMQYPGMMRGPGTIGGPGTMGGPGAMRGPGMRGGPGMGLHRTWALDLTEEQQKKLVQLQDGLRKRHHAVMGEMIDAQIQLRDSIMSEQPDPKAVGEAYAKIGLLFGQMMASMVEARNQAHAMLTDEQKAQMKQRPLRGMGRGMPEYR